MSMDRAVYDWLLSACPDADALWSTWEQTPEACLPVVTGASFDAVVMPVLLGRTVHGQFEWLLRHRVPAAVAEDSVVILVREGSVFGGPTVPAVLDVRRAGELVRLPSPDHATAWLRRPVGASGLPGFLSMPSVVREVLRVDHCLDNGWQHCDTVFPDAPGYVLPRLA